MKLWDNGVNVGKVIKKFFKYYSWFFILDVISTIMLKKEAWMGRS